MNDTEFDTALVTAAFRLAGERGWGRVSAAAAAREAGLSVAEARGRFASRASILLRFGQMADQEALADPPSDGPLRDRLFDLLMRRIDVLQAHRAGVKALLRALPGDPATAVLLALANQRSMRWMLQGAGIGATGIRGDLQVNGLLAVWLWAVRAWDRDDSTDLSATMAAIDTALNRADSAASWLHRGGGDGPPPAEVPTPPPVNPAAGELDPSVPPVVDPDAGDIPSGPPPASPAAGELDPSAPPVVDPGAGTIASGPPPVSPAAGGAEPPAPPPVNPGAGELDPPVPPPADHGLPDAGA